ncbi:MAG: DNA processing protein, partial [Gammaproteobacteria bacterium]|jgi:DNA processing protein
MDNGLDIGEQRCVLVFHAAVFSSHKKLVLFSREFVRLRSADTPIESTQMALESLARRLGCILDWGTADRSLEWASNQGCRIVTIFDPIYPSILREIPMPPIVLFVRGDLQALRHTQIAVVGSRKPSHSGIQIAFRIARALSERGFVITSGLASGIDGAAHRGALDFGAQTVAIFGCGIDRIYPARHRGLAEEIARNGSLVSEFPLGTPPRPFHFPRRNRIISGLSIGTLVVEAAEKSGSISTAMHALEQGREVFAIPGSIRNSMAAGCNRLIKQGATLVASIEDVIEQLPPLSARFVSPTSLIADDVSTTAKPINSVERLLLGALDFEQTTFDDIVHRTGLTTTNVSSILSALEVRGLVQSLAGNSYIKTVP